jgi:hypothetical protein
MRTKAAAIRNSCDMARAWYRDGPSPLVIYCRHTDCFRTHYIVASSVPVSCPGCSRQTYDKGDWWTTERPEDKPITGTISLNDKRFLEGIKIAPWDGGIDI